MNERDLTRLSYLFSSVVAYPYLTRRLAQSLFDRGGSAECLLAIETLRDLLPPEPTLKDIEHTRDVLTRSDDTNIRTTGRLLHMALKNRAVLSGGEAR